ncbi:MAG: ABC transporter substrate-binding protein [Desulfobacteraceae bacterium]|nr:MAG: ABC transporter substrate-binding protein [Desulfobacteraceae bacterium]
MERQDHPSVQDLKSDFEKGKLSRREFIRYAALLGVSAVGATQMAGLSLFSKPAHAASIKRGGTLRIAGPVQKMTHPAQFSWVTPSNQLRQVAEFLTFTDHNNVTHPALLENWKPSDDLKTWTLNLRKGVTFNNGDEFTADDVIFTMQQWLDDKVGSSMKGMMGAYLSASGIEKVNKHQIKLHLTTPEIGVPEHLFHYPALILNHKTFEGDFIKAPHGTGPFVIEKFVEGERCILKRRDDYWKKGADGGLLPYLDRIEYIDMGSEMSPMITAIKSNDIDMIDFGDVVATQAYQALKSDPNIKIQPVTTNITRILRMRVDKKPWDDNRVRMALKLCQNREKTLALAYFGEGLEGQDTHVSPKHPEYAPVKTPAYDPGKAKQLLKEAGYPNGLEVNLAVGSGWPEVVRYAEILKQDAAPAGLKINLQTMPNSQYWEKWTEVDLGITPWTHRPLGTMVLNLAYTADKDGKPVPWNESRWVDKEFSELLVKANGTLDIEKRRSIFAKLEKIQMERGSIANAFWINMWTITRKHVENLVAHPNAYLKADDVWLSA